MGHLDRVREAPRENGRRIVDLRWFVAQTGDKQKAREKSLLQDFLTAQGRRLFVLS